MTISVDNNILIRWLGASIAFLVLMTCPDDVYADECVGYASTSNSQSKKLEDALSIPCKKDPTRVPGNASGKSWRDACAEIGLTCEKVYDHEGRVSSCNASADDGSRAAWCVARVESRKSGAKPISSATICNGLLGEGKDKPGKEVHVGLKSGCVRVIHKGGAQQNLWITPGHVYEIPKSSGFNCSC